MRNRIVGISIVLVALLTTYSCDEQPTKVENTPKQTSGRFEDYIILDTTKYYLVRQTDFDRPNSPSRPQKEVILGWEHSFGEPFTDVNGNGTYDPGIDIFLISLGPGNNDINGNSNYDGPSNQCTPNMPFDDIDGNGVCTPLRSGDTKSYSPGIPFQDINSNGIYDSALAYSYEIVRIIRTPTLVHEIEVTRQLFITGSDEATFFFTSDSGYSYPSFGVSAKRPDRTTLYTTDSGIRFSDFNYRVYTIDTGAIHAYDTTWMFRGQVVNLQVEFGASLSYMGETYEDLLHVRIEKTPSSIDYYFAKNEGLRAIRRDYVEGGHRINLFTEWPHPTPTSLTQ